jgi:ATP-binding cassette subfamily B (MDR/TAP) protein 1
MHTAQSSTTPLPANFQLSRKDSPTPLPTNFRLSRKAGLEGDHMKSVSYAPAVDSLMYVMVATWPDIAHAVGVVSRFMHNLG